MGIESDRLVFDYLSRVGDLAQQRQLPSGTRMRLVTELRGEIDKHRSGGPGDSPAAVRRILSRLGSPDEVVSAAGRGGRDAPRARERGPASVTDPGPASAAPRRAAPSDAEAPDAAGGRTSRPTPVHTPVEQDPEEPGEGLPRALRRLLPGPRGGKPPADPSPSAGSPPGAAPSHPAGLDGMGPGSPGSDWWRVGGRPSSGHDSVPGFIGGVEIPEILGFPTRERPGEAAPLDNETDGAGDAPLVEAAEAGAAPRRRLPRLWGVARAEGRARWTNPLLLLAAALLVAGAVLGNWFALGLGWVIAYASRRLTRGEAKAAVFVLPGLALVAGIVWLWGRDNNQWGTPITEGHMGDAVSATWPWVIRGAAAASALFLIWRSQRGRS